MRRVTRIAAVAFALLLPLQAKAASADHPGTFDLPPSAQFDPGKLKRIDRFFEHNIAQGKIPGAVVYIERYGKPVYSGYFGTRGPFDSGFMASNTIFRLHSLTKIITSVAAMTLIDQGRLKLDEPLSTYLPAFANLKVGVEQAQPDGRKSLALEPTKRPITIRDLMRHTSGITYGFYGDSLVRKTYAASRLYEGDPTTAEFADRIAKLPLQEQPGTMWDYGHSADVLGRVIEVVSGKTLLEYEQEVLLKPLGMVDTTFVLADEAHLARTAHPELWDEDFHTGRVDSVKYPIRWQSGGGGMLSTLHDMSALARMLLAKGNVNGKQILSPAAFAEMTRDQVGPGSGIARDYLYFPGDGFGYSLGFGVRTDPGNAEPPAPGSLGELKWDGASGCYLFIDPKMDMFVILMEQTPSQRQRIQRGLKALVYEALAN